jgi:RecA/RadA recombinase
MRKIKRLVRKPVISSRKKKVIKTGNLISTGSTLLDLAILGDVKKGGGVPGSIVIEVYGPAGTGKTAVLAELAGSAQTNGGDVRFLDPEARLDEEYSRIYGMELKRDNYFRPDTVVDMFDHIMKWEPKSKKRRAINLVASDSLAALTTKMELSDGGDKYGMKRAKDFSEGWRKTCRLIANNGWVVACSNQERSGPSGVSTPGGKSTGYYASLRIRLAPMFPKSKIKEKRTIGGNTVSKIRGIITKATVTKSSIDSPYREAILYIVFGYGIDDIRGNLQYCKDMTNDSKYNCVTKQLSSINAAIKYIEEEELHDQIKEKTIDLWYEVEEKLKIERKKKTR